MSDSDSKSASNGEPESASDLDDSNSDDSAEAAERHKKWAAEKFAEMLINTFLDNMPMTAMTLCILCHYAQLAGVSGFATEFAMPPGRQTGKYSFRVKRVLGFDKHDSRLMRLEIPCHSKYDLCRSRKNIWVLPPHEALHYEVADNPSITQRVRDSIVGQEWADNYNDHVVVKRHIGKTVLPYALYLDGAPFTKNDGFLGIFVYCLITMERHLCVLLRKSEMCKCGCRGWCTLFVVLHFLHACFAQLADGRFFDRRPDGSVWLASDVVRESVAGTAMSVIGALCHIKADWAEIITTFGYPSWSSIFNLCFCCEAEKDDMMAIGPDENAGVDSLPWRLKTHDSYTAACNRCEFWVAIPTREVHRSVLRLLAYDKRTSSKLASFGRALSEDLTIHQSDGVTVELLTGDRLEPHGLMRDHAEFDTVVCFPYEALFWRRSRETAARHRNPLFDPDIGITQHIISIDGLHTLNLGPYQRFCMYVFWTMIIRNVYGVSGGNQDILAGTVLRLRSDLMAYYANLPSDVRSTVTQVEDLTIKMLGSRAKPKLKTKAAESKGLIPFAVQLLKEHKSKMIVKATSLIEAGHALLNFINLMEDNGRVLPRRVVEDPSCGSAGISQTPDRPLLKIKEKGG